MCGIVGLFIKNPALERQLGEHLSNMLIEMTDRGPDSAGVALYREPVELGRTKLSLVGDDPDYDWRNFAKECAERLGDQFELEVRGSHAIVKATETYESLKAWLHSSHPDLQIVSAGDTIEIFKETGLPKDVVEQFDLRGLGGTHGLGHTRMATESAVTTAGSHPFSTGLDLCLVHNGSLSNHNRWRAYLKTQGLEFKTENDTEVAAAYLTWRLQEGASLKDALDAGLKDLDGFYTFAVGTRDGFAVLRDPIACKHAVMAETDDWVAVATEFRAIATLPDADKAAIWEPAPGKIYNWSRT